MQYPEALESSEMPLVGSHLPQWKINRSGGALLLCMCVFASFFFQ